MFLNKNNFNFNFLLFLFILVVSVIEDGIIIYTFYDNFTFYYIDSAKDLDFENNTSSGEFFKDDPELLDSENNISFGDLLVLARDQQQIVDVPANGYNITNPTVLSKNTRI